MVNAADIRDSALAMRAYEPPHHAPSVLLDRRKSQGWGPKAWVLYSLIDVIRRLLTTLLNSKIFLHLCMSMFCLVICVEFFARTTGDL